MKITFTLMLAVIFTSCNSQVDIEQFEYGVDVSTVVENINESKKGTDATTSLESYASIFLDDLKYGDVELSSYKVPNGYPSDYNRIDFLIDDQKYVGVSMHLVEESEGRKIFKYIEKMYGQPSKKFKEDGNESGYYLWDNPHKKNLVYLRHNQSRTREKGVTFYDTHVTIVKKGINVIPNASSDSAAIEAILKDNPNAFSLLEVFKNVFPN